MVDADLCQFGLVAKDKHGQGAVKKKPTRFITNSECVARRLSERCKGCARHVILEGKAMTQAGERYTAK